MDKEVEGQMDGKTEQLFFQLTEYISMLMALFIHIGGPIWSQNIYILFKILMINVFQKVPFWTHFCCLPFSVTTTANIHRHLG